MDNKNIGNCKFCWSKMNITQNNCPKCGAGKDECFISIEMQKLSRKALTAKINKNMSQGFKAWLKKLIG